MNVDEQLSAILKEHAPRVDPHPRAWDRIITSRPNHKTRWYAGAAAAAVATVALGAMVLITPSRDRRAIAPAISLSSAPSTTTTTSAPPSGAGLRGRIVFARGRSVRVETFQRNPDGFSTSESGVARAPSGTRVDDVDVTSDGTVVFAAGFEACASGIYSASIGTTSSEPQAQPLNPDDVTTLVAPRAGVTLRLPTIDDGRLAFVRSTCSKPAGGTQVIENEKLVVRDLASTSERVIGEAQGSTDTRLSWAAGRYLIFTSHGMPSGLVIYDTERSGSALTARADIGCYWGPPAGHPADPAVAAVEVCAEQSRVSAFTIDGNRLERNAVMFTVDGEITWLDYDGSGSRLLSDVDGQIKIHNSDGTSSPIPGESVASRPVW